MSDCLHCDIHEMLEVHLQAEQADLAEIAARVTEVLVDLIVMAPPDERTMLMADFLANLGGIVLQKIQEDADPANPGRSRHDYLRPGAAETPAFLQFECRRNSVGGGRGGKYANTSTRCTAQPTNPDLARRRSTVANPPRRKFRPRLLLR
jgi:hypothetical protein